MISVPQFLHEKEGTCDASNPLPWYLHSHIVPYSLAETIFQPVCKQAGRYLSMATGGEIGIPHVTTKSQYGPYLPKEDPSKETSG